MTARSGRLLDLAAYGVVPLLLLATFLSQRQLGYDLHAVWDAAKVIEAGGNPYPAVAAIPAHPVALDAYVYPPAVALLLVPLTFLPFHLVALSFGLLDAAAAIVGVRLVGVRDWRCYGVVVASLPLLGSARLGTLSPLLALLAACAWRYRARPLPSAAAVAAALVAKLFLWPLLVWLAATRRVGTAALAAAGGLAVALAAWAAIGFAGLGRYPALLHRVSAVQYEKSFSLAAFLGSIGLDGGAGRVVLVAVGAALTAGIVVAGRRGADEPAFTLAVLASLLLAPIVWLHYFVLLAVPIAVASPRLGPRWALLLALWAVPWEESNRRPGLIAGALAITLLTVVWPRGLQPRRRSTTTLPSL